MKKVCGFAGILADNKLSTRLPRSTAWLTRECTAWVLARVELSPSSCCEQALNHPAVFAYLHVPVQSGSDAVLGAMAPRVHGRRVLPCGRHAARRRARACSWPPTSSAASQARCHTLPTAFGLTPAQAMGTHDSLACSVHMETRVSWTPLMNATRVLLILAAMRSW